jgi:putative membrane protein
MSVGTTELARHARLPLWLALAIVIISAVSLPLSPAGHASWFLEVGPGLAYAAVLGGVFKRLPLSHAVYVGVFLHTLILIYGGMYTYAETPLGLWAKDAFHLSRNHYDRVGHVALGLFPAITIREIYVRLTDMKRGGWLFFTVCSVALAIGAFWELLEWWVTLLVASDTGVAFLGSQGDVWDAQWDMFLALVGAAVALALLGKVHDASMKPVSDA